MAAGGIFWTALCRIRPPDGQNNKKKNALVPDSRQVGREIKW
jgi:hypothetical protein